ncbi:MAG: DUF1015 domain-containing protein [Acidimicrobiales bacterium]
MPRLEPFRGLRYDSTRVVLDDVIAPPYDVVDETERARLAARSRYNSVLIELPIADQSSGLDRYQHAATLLDAWERDRILVRDEHESFYAYRMTFRNDDAVERSTTGVIGALGLDDDGGEVLPHEATVSRFSKDRLDLLRACQVNVSPIWCLSLAEGLSKSIASAIEVATGHLQATDDHRVVHEVWRIEDPGAIAEIASRVHPEPFVIADGHHRFETATRYRKERRELNGDEPGDYDYLMSLVVELRPDELDVWPIHRIISGLPEGIDVAQAIGTAFAVHETGGTVRDLLQEMTAHNALGLVTTSKLFLIEPPPAAAKDGIDALDTRRLDDIVEALPAHAIAFEHRVDAALDAVRSGRADAAILVKPASIPQIAEAARHKTTMPPKTTFFRPKPRTGFVFRSVEC